jgi:hypothetical protein
VASEGDPGAGEEALTAIESWPPRSAIHQRCHSPDISKRSIKSSQFVEAPSVTDKFAHHVPVASLSCHPGYPGLTPTHGYCHGGGARLAPSHLTSLAFLLHLRSQLGPRQGLRCLSLTILLPRQSCTQAFHEHLVSLFLFLSFFISFLQKYMSAVSVSSAHGGWLALGFTPLSCASVFGEGLSFPSFLGCPRELSYDNDSRSSCQK